MSDTQILDLLPGQVNIEAFQGDDFSNDVTIQDLAGTPYVLTTSKMQVKTMSGTVVATLTVGSGITITNPGVITIAISKTAMAALVATNYRYDLQVTLTSTGLQRTMIAGLFTVNAETTI